MELRGKKVVDWELDFFMVEPEDLDVDHWLFTDGEFEDGKALTGNQLEALSKKYRHVIYDVAKNMELLPKNSPFHEKYGKMAIPVEYC